MSRTKTILNNSELKKIKYLIRKKGTMSNAKEVNVYIRSIVSLQDGEILEKNKGNVSGYIWNKKIRRGYISLNITVINGYEDPLFNDEGYVKIYYEIFPSASMNLRNSKIFDTFITQQNTIKANNYIETKKIINKIFRNFILKK